MRELKWNAGRSDSQAVLRSAWQEESGVPSEHQEGYQILRPGFYAFIRTQFRHKDKPAAPCHLPTRCSEMESWIPLQPTAKSQLALHRERVWKAWLDPTQIPPHRFSKWCQVNNPPGYLSVQVWIPFHLLMRNLSCRPSGMLLRNLLF